MSQERRRYPRVFLDKSLEDFKEIIGVQVYWPNGDVGGALDISYVGAALTKPAGLPITFSAGEDLPLHFQFSKQNILVHAHFVREIPQAIGVYFSNLEPKAHLEFEKFLKHKLIGMNTRLIPNHFYSREQSFSYWYHGPDNTNIFIWHKYGKIEKATIELASQVLFIEGEELSYLEIDNWSEHEEYAYYIKTDDHKNNLENTSFYESVVSVLTQVPAAGGPINQLLTLLKNSRR